MEWVPWSLVGSKAERGQPAFSWGMSAGIVSLRIGWEVHRHVHRDEQLQMDIIQHLKVWSHAASRAFWSGVSHSPRRRLMDTYRRSLRGSEVM